MKPLLILDQHFRKLEELFRPDTYSALNDICDIRGGQNWPMDRATIETLLPDATFYVAAQPKMNADQVATAKNLRATMEVSGAFRDGLDYTACFEKGVEILSCSPGFRHSVAEMTLSMMLASGRGLIDEHEAFRQGHERWLDDQENRDFTLYGQTVGFIGYGQISRETHRLMKPFAPNVVAFDPFVSNAGPDVALTDLDTLVKSSRVIVVAAVPSEETRGLLSADLIRVMQPGTLVVVISRAWCTDFPALINAANTGQIRVATDVFPDEPVQPNDPIRQSRNVILSPHRAAAVPGGRHPIGEMILTDVTAILEGRSERSLKPADPALVGSMIAAQSGMQKMANT